MSVSRHLGSPVARFLALGGANTAITGAAFYGLSFVMEARLAFTIVYVCGLAFVTMVTPRFVFRARPRHRHRAAMAAWYVLVYVCGLAMTSLLDRELHFPHLVVVVGTLALTAPLGFLGARAIVGSDGDDTVPG